VKAMLEGDWDVVAGAALDIDRERHMVRPSHRAPVSGQKLGNRTGDLSALIA